jgi:hypothetical protein
MSSRAKVWFEYVASERKRQLSLLDAIEVGNEYFLSNHDSPAENARRGWPNEGAIVVAIGKDTKTALIKYRSVRPVGDDHWGFHAAGKEGSVNPGNLYPVPGGL